MSTQPEIQSSKPHAYTAEWLMRRIHEALFTPGNDAFVRLIAASTLENFDKIVQQTRDHSRLQSLTPPEVLDLVSTALKNTIEALRQESR